MKKLTILMLLVSIFSILVLLANSKTRLPKRSAYGFLTKAMAIGLKTHQVMDTTVKSLVKSHGLMGNLRKHSNLTVDMCLYRTQMS